jgi:hypothetical protein
MTLRASVVAVSATFLLVLVTACGSDEAPKDDRAVTGTTEGEPYELYTHCGIEWAKIDGTMWRARPALSDGSGNPPPGWGNPSQKGTLTFVDTETAVFTSTAGTVTFHRTRRDEPPVLCD